MLAELSIVDRDLLGEEMEQHLIRAGPRALANTLVIGGTQWGAVERLATSVTDQIAARLHPHLPHATSDCTFGPPPHPKNDAG